MTTYNVKQIAEILDTSEETIRRWIRSNKLRAVQTSRKDGNIITEEELQRFLKSSPKYKSRFAVTGMAISLAVGAANPFMGAPILLATLLGGKSVDDLNAKNQTEISIRLEEVKKTVVQEIEQSKKSIQTKKKSIQELEQEISELEQKIAELNYMLDRNEQALSQKNLTCASPVDGNEGDDTTLK